MTVLATREWLASPVAAGIVSLDNPWWLPGAPASRFGDVLTRIDVLLPSESDVEAYYGRPFDSGMVRDLSDRGCPRIVVKQGARGCLVFDGPSKTTTHLPAIPTNVVDPTGAGDAFCGGFLASFLETRDMIRSAIQGSVSASFAIGSVGTSAALGAPRTERDARERWLADRTTTSRAASSR
jgi:ribokinase